MIWSMLGLGAALCAAAAFVHVSDPGAIIATMIGGVVGASISAVAFRNAAFTPEARMRHPLAWPGGAIPEDPRRTRIWTAAIMIAMDVAFVVVFQVADTNEDFLVFYAGLTLIFGLLWITKYRQVMRLEHTLGVELYRELTKPPRFRFRPRYYARQP